MEKTQPVKDEQTISSRGESIAPRIEGVVIRRAVPVEDKRGETVEVFSERWGLNRDPLVYVSQISLRPGAIKGWLLHMKQDNRIFLSRGVVRFALYDDRPNSTTHGMVNVFTFSERNRCLIIVPCRLYYAVQNIGQEEAILISMPTEFYNHSDPDEYRLPLKNGLIPFDFDDGPGW